MIDASDDEVVRQSFFLLTQIPIAARADDFPKALRRVGIAVGDDPGLVELCSAMMSAVDRFISSKGVRTDYGEIAQLAVVESVYRLIGRELSDLFDTDRRLKMTLSSFAEPRHFAVLAREFFARLTRRHLDFYLSRELASHVGTDQYFPSLAEHEDFETALDLHCREATRIIKEFSADWFYKHTVEDGIDRELAGRFVHVAAGKIRDELVRRDTAHA
ncbi:hypothetical protein [Mesorhizobium sp. KR9-304]|uniref:hypothetical protein n=1 Tax=Mesorhizobium sp. KR9-304 TaxID=3156614 RepID=UPI0032B43071